MQQEKKLSLMALISMAVGMVIGAGIGSIPNSV